VVPLFAVAVAVGHVGWVAGGISAWDERQGARRFALQVAEILDRAGPKASVYSWGDPQTKLAFYSRRVLPGIQWRFRREYPGAPDADIRDQVFSWLAEEPTAAEWIILQRESQEEHPDFVDPSARLIELGYLPVVTVEDETDPGTLFILFHRPPPTGPASAVNGMQGRSSVDCTYVSITRSVVDGGVVAVCRGATPRSGPSRGRPRRWQDRGDCTRPPAG
jgi:hypothetical protein